MVACFVKLEEQKFPKSSFLICDTAVEEKGKKLHLPYLSLTGGEKIKSPQMVESLIHTLFIHGCDRKTALIAMGGGTLLDLVGFIASIYMRGIPLFYIPTTLLAMVDAAIGGKTAINTSFSKNLLGSFYPPHKTYIDLSLLDTLPEKEWKNGKVEIDKLGLVYDPSLWEETDQKRLIQKAILGKKAIVKKDPYDRGIRRILNFGHTIGHALESLSHYTMSHGEAVATGCLIESHLSASLGYLPQEALKQILCRFSLRLPEEYTREKLLNAIQKDKKNEGGKIHFIIIDKIGHTVPFLGTYCRDVSIEELTPTLDWMEGICWQYTK